MVTATIGSLAKKGAGKSFTAKELVEGLLEAGQQVMIVDQPYRAPRGPRLVAAGRQGGRLCPEPECQAEQRRRRLQLHLPLASG